MGRDDPAVVVPVSQPPVKKGELGGMRHLAPYLIPHQKS
jgi:hypothetical protein